MDSDRSLWVAWGLKGIDCRFSVSNVSALPWESAHLLNLNENGERKNRSKGLYGFGLKNQFPFKTCVSINYGKTPAEGMNNSSESFQSDQRFNWIVHSFSTLSRLNWLTEWTKWFKFWFDSTIHQCLKGNRRLNTMWNCRTVRIQNPHGYVLKCRASASRFQFCSHQQQKRTNQWPLLIHSPEWLFQENCFSRVVNWQKIQIVFWWKFQIVMIINVHMWLWFSPDLLMSSHYL